MAFGIYSSPGHIGRNGISRYAKLPAIALLQIGSTVKDQGRMRAWESMVTRSVGSSLAYAQLKCIVQRERGGCPYAQLEEPLSVMGKEAKRHTGCRREQTSHICRMSHKPATGAYIHAFPIPLRKGWDGYTERQQNQNGTKRHGRYSDCYTEM